MTGIDAGPDSPARSAFRRGLLASGISVGGLVPANNDQVAAEMFRAVTRADPGVCDGWLGRVLAGEDSLDVLAGAWAAAETFGWETRRLGVLGADFRPAVFDGLFLQLPVSSVDALRCAYATALIRGEQLQPRLRPAHLRRGAGGPVRRRHAQLRIGAAALLHAALDRCVAAVSGREALVPAGIRVRGHGDGHHCPGVAGGF